MSVCSYSLVLRTNISFVDIEFVLLCLCRPESPRRGRKSELGMTLGA